MSKDVEYIEKDGVTYIITQDKEGQSIAFGVDSRNK
jgi:hypothetical protein